MSHSALALTHHRPWPFPSGPWSIAMEWNDLAFLHWRVDAKKIQALLPEGLELEMCDGSAWLGVVPFRMERTRARWFPPILSANTFPELNVRTYVRCAGKSGVWFFSLDAASRLAVEGARVLFGLPYFSARMNCVRRDDSIVYDSERCDRRAPSAAFHASWRACGECSVSAPGTLEHFLTERYCLYSVRRGSLLRGDVAHVPWQVGPVELSLTKCTMTRLLGIDLDRPPESALIARSMQVLAWTPRAV